MPCTTLRYTQIYMRFFYELGADACRAYRKTVIAGMPGLHHLDEMPVTAKERRLAMAYMQGGLEVLGFCCSHLLQQPFHPGSVDILTRSCA